MNCFHNTQAFICVSRTNPHSEKGFCCRTRKEDAFFPAPPAIQCLEEQQERKHGDLSELMEAAASSAEELLMDCSTYRWKKPLSQFSLSLSLSFYTLYPQTIQMEEEEQTFRNLRSQLVIRMDRKVAKLKFPVVHTKSKQYNCCIEQVRYNCV